jgi:hypothetical protein
MNKLRSHLLLGSIELVHLTIVACHKAPAALLLVLEESDPARYIPRAQQEAFASIPVVRTDLRVVHVVSGQIKTGDQQSRVHLRLNRSGGRKGTEESGGVSCRTNLNCNDASVSDPNS